LCDPLPFPHNLREDVVTEEKAYLKEHTVSGEKLLFDLPRQLAELRAELPENRDRRGITLVKEHGITVVLTALKQGAQLREHDTPGPATVQVIDGEVAMKVGDEGMSLGPGQLIAFDARVPHEVEATSDAAILITVLSEPAAS
jgi:quercetin dioxygenase-like cupin family protein